MGLLELPPITPRSLYQYACRHGLEDQRIRICDGMAVSYFPSDEALCRSKDKVVLELSCEPVYEFDELSYDDQCIIYKDGTRYQPPKELKLMKDDDRPVEVDMTIFDK